MTASIVGDIATITRLCENGANAHLTDAQGNNALIAAVMANKTESVRFLLQNKLIDPEHRNNDGKAAIDFTHDSENGHNIKAMLQVYELKNAKKRSAEELSINIDDKSSIQTPDDDPHKDKPNHKFYKLIKKSRDNSSGANLGRS
jgi:ankyrin repeat protein